MTVKKAYKVENAKTQRIYGYFFEDDKTKYYGHNLTGITAVFDFFTPFGDMVSPVAIPWLEKINKSGTEDMDIEELVRNLNIAKDIFKRTTSEIINDGLTAEDFLESKLKKVFYEPKDYSTEKGVKIGEAMYKKLVEAFGSNLRLVESQIALGDTETRCMGKFDFIVENIDNGEMYLIDAKAGSFIKESEGNSKYVKAVYQLSLYNYLYKEYYGKAPDKVFILNAGYDYFTKEKESFELEDLFFLEKELKEYSQIIDITNLDLDKLTEGFFELFESYKLAKNSKLVKKVANRNGDKAWTLFFKK